MEDQLSLEGMEFDWFARDRTGKLGLFATAGAGFVPSVVLASHSCHSKLADIFENPNWGSELVWNDIASLGLYVYDWSNADNSYNLVSAPSAVIGTELRRQIENLGSLPTLDVAFAVSARILRFN